MTTRLRCILLDDELSGLSYLKMLCEQLPEVAYVKAYNSVDKFLKEYSQNEADLFLLDIEMPGMNGLEVASLLPGKSIIFTTAYKEFASEAFDLNAVDYLRKPISSERLQQGLQKALKHLEQQKSVVRKSIHLNTDKGKSILFQDQICYLQTSDSDSRDKTVLMEDGTFTTLKNISFEKLEQLLSEDLFCRINKKQIISMERIRFYTHQEITTTLSDSSNKPIIFQLNESYREAFFKKVKR